ncbi:MAG: AAA family ATPase [Deltaproteobacteria bacterium]|nr:AAA family ATPase [Deltaproteobacteria bacterium]MBW2112079.1 AAA family ATPase [Deltaproteobacteria bacterium]
MYNAYFGLTENPFALTPDPRFLFMSQRHREALAHLLFGIGERCGFVLLTGEVGTGKTTLCRSLLEQIPEGVEVALVLNPKQTALELVASLCDELSISYPAGTESLKVLVDLLNLHLLEIHARGRRTVLIIDEAQNLSADVLEQIRLLTNLETPTQKLLQILLIGQPELQTIMARPELRQLSQRITARYHLTPLLLNETTTYIGHRLEVAGCKRRLFTRGALRLVHRLSGGVPRLINTICDRALLGAYAGQRDRVNRGLVRKAASEVMGPRSSLRSPRVLRWAVIILILLILGAGWRFLDPPIIWEQVVVTGKPAPSVDTPGPPKGAVNTETGPRENGDGGEEASSLVRDLLTAGDVPTDRDSAFETLFRQWEREYPDLPGLTPCERAEKVGLRCMRGRGNWTILGNLNRPAILEVVDEDQRTHYLPVVSMEGPDVTLELGFRRETLNRSGIEPFWFGDFTILWRPPPLNRAVMKRGDSGPDVLWLRSHLDSLEGSPPGIEIFPPSPFFDDTLKRRVMDFQRAHFVKADGIVGEQTLIQLNTAAGDDSIPLLCDQIQHGERHVIDP